MCVVNVKRSFQLGGFGYVLLAVIAIFPALISISAATLFSSINTPDRDRDRDRGPSSNLDMDNHHGGFHSSGLLLGHPDSEHHLNPQGLCEPIKISLCMELGYNQTTMPNLVGHDVQGDAEALLRTFTPLIQYGCSPNLKLFLCSAHVPMCTDKVPEPIGPCRSLCESVRRKCEPVLLEFGFKWPPPLDCAKFHPANNHQHMCIPDPSAADYSSSGGFAGFSSGGSDFSPKSSGGQAPGSGSGGVSPNNGNLKTASGIPRRSNPNPAPPASEPSAFQFPISGSVITYLKPQSPSNINLEPTLKPETQSGSENLIEARCLGPRKIWSKGSCWIKCGLISTASGAFARDDPTISTSLFHPNEKTFARNYALLWAILSLSAALIALLLSVCSPKLSTAERPILYIALCQILFSIGVILGSTGSVSCFTEKSTGMELLAMGGMVPSSCAVVFLLTYFFGMAATLWWVILCLSWLLALNRDLCLSLQQKEWSMFHLGSWGIASLLTSTALIHKKVDADELTGLCGVGFQSTDALTYYNMIPLNISLSLGLLFLTIGLMQRMYPGWKQLIFQFGQARIKSSHPSGSGNHCRQMCERELQLPSVHTNGYTPVLVMPPLGVCGPHCHQSHNPTCCSSYNNNRRGNHVNTNGTTGSSALTFSSSGVQRLKALENSKAIWTRVGIFALVHSLPIACQVGTMAYELYSRENWESGQERPILQIFLLRLNMNLIAGLTAGVWVLSTYTWKSLFSIFQKFRCCCCLNRNRRKSSQEKIQEHFRGGSLVTTATSDPLLPPITNSAQSPISNQRSTSNVLSSFVPGTHVIQPSSRDNFAAILPRHHNHPLPRIPVPPSATATTATAAGRNAEPPPRTDAWRRGETIV